MPTIEIDGVGRVQVDDSFLTKTPEQQDQIVAQIRTQATGGGAPEPVVDPDVYEDPIGPSTTPAPVQGPPLQDPQGFFEEYLSPVVTYRDADGSTYMGPTIPDNMKLMGDPGYMLTKAARDTAMGLGNIPSAIAGALGYDETAEDLRLEMPPVRGGSMGEDVGAAVLQYLPTGAGGAKVGSKLLGKVAPKTGAVGGAAVTDAMVTDATETGTLGDVLGGPTATDEDDNALEMRGKVALESLALPAIAAGAWKPLSLTGRGTASLMRWLGDTVTSASEKGRRSAAGEMLRAAVPDPDDTIRTLEQPSIIDEFSPTASQVAQEPGLRSLERGTAALPDNEAARTVQQPRQKQPGMFKESVDQGLPGGRTTGEFGETVSRQDLDEVAAAEGRASQADEALSRAERGVQANEAPITGARGTLDDRAEDVTDFVQGRYDEMRSTKGELYDQIDPKRSVEVNPSRSQGRGGSIGKTVQELTTPAAPADRARVQAVRQYAGPLLDTIKDSLKLSKTAKQGTKNRIYFKDLQEWRKRLNAVITQAQKDGAGDVVEALTPLREQLNRVPRQLNGGRGGPTAERAAAAETFFKDEFAPRFREGEGGRFANDARNPLSKGAQQPKAVANRFLGRTGDEAASLERIIQGAPNEEAARGAVREYVVAEMADKVVKNGRVDPAALDSYIRQRGGVLDQFPDVKEELIRLRNQSRSNVKLTGRLAEDAKSAHKELETLQRSQQTGPAAKFKDRDPVNAVDEVLNSKTASRDMKVLLDRAKDSAEALDDLKAATTDALRRRIGADRAEDLLSKSSVKKLSETLRPGSETRKALEQVYSPQEVEMLDMYHKQMDMLLGPSSAGNSLKPNTPENLTAAMSKTRPLVAATFGIIRGNAISNLSKLLLKGLGMDPEQAYRRLMAEALTDPKLAAELMKEATPKQVSKIKKLAQDLGTVRGERKAYVGEDIATEVLTRDKDEEAE